MSDTGAKSRESKTDVGNATGRGKALARPAAPEVWTQPKEPQSISRTVRESRLEDRLREHETTDENWTSGTSEASPALGPRTVVEQGTEFKGVFVSDCAIEVKGRVEGDVAAPSLTIAASGAVEGSVKVGELSSEGAIAGDRCGRRAAVRRREGQDRPAREVAQDEARAGGDETAGHVRQCTRGDDGGCARHADQGVTSRARSATGVSRG